MERSSLSILWLLLAVHPSELSCAAVPTFGLEPSLVGRSPSTPSLTAAGCPAWH